MPFVHRVWAPRDRQPAIPVRRRDRWRYADGFVRPRTGPTWSRQLPTISIASMNLACPLRP